VSDRVLNKIAPPPILDNNRTKTDNNEIEDCKLLRTARITNISVSAKKHETNIPSIPSL
jgi:hypothetical protein